MTPAKNRTASSRLKLSICIATFNRAGFIGETLESIVPQLTREVELLVVDGASTDNTRAIVEERVNSGRNVRYIRLPEKGGVDRDYCRAAEHARGEFIWLFTDDDLLDPDAVERVLREIKGGYSALIVNARVRSNDLTDVLVPAMLDDTSDSMIEGKEVDRLFETIVPYISYIGCLVMNKRVWFQRNKEKYFGTEFVHVGTIFQSPLPGKIKIISRPAISIRYGNAQWTSRASLIWLGNWPHLLSSLNAVSEEMRRKKTNLVSWGEFKKMIVYRALRSYSLDTFKKLMSQTPSPFWWRSVAFLVALLPTRLLKVIITWYLKSFRLSEKETRMTLLDLSRV